MIEAKDTEEVETSLSVELFKGKCNACGKEGHKAQDCKNVEAKKALNVDFVDKSGIKRNFAGKRKKMPARGPWIRNHR